VSQYWQRQYTVVCANALDLLDDVSLDWHDNLCLCNPHVAQGTRLNQADVDWAMRVVGQLAKVVVQKASPRCQGPLSSVSTRNTLCDSTLVHAQHCQPLAHAQTGPASFLNKIRQT
jgi:hypothetical protein